MKSSTNSLRRSSMKTYTVQQCWTAVAALLWQYSKVSHIHPKHISSPLTFFAPRLSAFFRASSKSSSCPMLACNDTVIPQQSGSNLQFDVIKNTLKDNNRAAIWFTGICVQCINTQGTCLCILTICQLVIQITSAVEMQQPRHGWNQVGRPL